MLHDQTMCNTLLRKDEDLVLWKSLCRRDRHYDTLSYRIPKTPENLQQRLGETIRTSFGMNIESVLLGASGCGCDLCGGINSDYDIRDGGAHHTLSRSVTLSVTA